MSLAALPLLTSNAAICPIFHGPIGLLACMWIGRVMRSRYRQAMQQERAHRDDAVRQAAALAAELKRLQLHHQRMVTEGEHNELLHNRAHWKGTALRWSV